MNCIVHKFSRQDYRIGTAQKMSVDIDATPGLLLLIQQKLRIVQYRYSSLSTVVYGNVYLPYIQSVAKNVCLRFFATFSAIAWHLIAKFYQCI